MNTDHFASDMTVTEEDLKNIIIQGIETHNCVVVADSFKLFCYQEDGGQLQLHCQLMVNFDDIGILSVGVKHHEIEALVKKMLESKGRSCEQVSIHPLPKTS